jgi:hypothetical protein
MSKKEEKRQVTYKKKPEAPKHFSGISTPGEPKLSGSAKMLSDVENFQQEEVEKTLPSTPVDILCVHCKDRVGYIIPSECRLPLTGAMIHPHRGCEGWPLPAPGQGPLEFICPHALDEGGDLHLFINITEGQHEKANSFFSAKDYKPFNVVEVLETRFCLCGCGEKVRGEKKNYTGLECWKRHMMDLHGEEMTTEEDQPQGTLCPCGCGGEVKGKNKFADSLNCYRRVQAEAKKVEIEDGTRDS